MNGISKLVLQYTRLLEKLSRGKRSSTLGQLVSFEENTVL